MFWHHRCLSIHKYEVVGGDTGCAWKVHKRDLSEHFSSMFLILAAMRQTSEQGPIQVWWFAHSLFTSMERRGCSSVLQNILCDPMLKRNRWWRTLELHETMESCYASREHGGNYWPNEEIHDGVHTTSNQTKLHPIHHSLQKVAAQQGFPHGCCTSPIAD